MDYVPQGATKVETKTITFRGFEVKMVLVDDGLDLWVSKAGPHGAVKHQRLANQLPITLDSLPTDI